MINKYKDLKLGKYIEVLKALKDKEDDIECQVAVISILNDMDEDIVLRLPLDEYHSLALQSNFLLNRPMGDEAKIPSHITIGKNKYKVVKDYRKITSGQYIDYNQLISMPDYWQYLPNIIACFLLPDGKEYGEYDIDEVANDIAQNMDTQTAYNFVLFFANKTRKSLVRTLRYLEVWTKMAKRKMKDEEKKEMEKAVEMIQAVKDSLDVGIGIL